MKKNGIRKRAVIIALLSLALFAGLLGLRSHLDYRRSSGEMASFKAASVAELREGTNAAVGFTGAGASVNLRIGGDVYRTRADEEGRFRISEIQKVSAGTKYIVQFRSGILSFEQPGKVLPKTWIRSDKYEAGSSRIAVRVHNIRRGDRVAVMVDRRKYRQTAKKNKPESIFVFDIGELKKNDMLNLVVFGQYQQEVAQKAYLIK